MRYRGRGVLALEGSLHAAHRGQGSHVQHLTIAEVAVRSTQLVLSRPLGLEPQIRTDLRSVVFARVAESQQLRLATGQVRRSIRSSAVAAEVGGAVGACSLITHRWLLLRWRSGSGLISWSLLSGLFLFSSRATLLRGLRRTGDCGGRGRCVLGSTGDRGGLWF